MHATGEYTIAELMEVFSVGRATVYRVLGRAAGTAPGPVAGAAGAGDVITRLPESSGTVLGYFPRLVN